MNEEFAAPAPVNRNKRAHTNRSTAASASPVAPLPSRAAAAAAAASAALSARSAAAHPTRPRTQLSPFPSFSASAAPSFPPSLGRAPAQPQPQPQSQSQPPPQMGCTVSSTAGPRLGQGQVVDGVRTFTAEDVAQHNKEKDCYTIFEGKVYDVTNYLRLHPGGPKLLFKNAGLDSTADFLAVHHSPRARALLNKYYVGELVSAHAVVAVKGISSSAEAPAVGALVRPQQYLLADPSRAGSATPTPSNSSDMPPPPARPSKLTPSTSHPERLNAYKEQQQKQDSISIVNSHALAINLHPPSHSQTAAATATVAPAVPATAAPAAEFAPRRFRLKERSLQTANNVQLLVFEPVFPSKESSQSAAPASSSPSSHVLHVAPSRPSLDGLDPALWLHVPPGQHISLGLKIDGAYVKRQYTPVSNKAGCFDLLIKSYPAPAGLFSRALHSLPLLSAVDVYGPSGRFDFDRGVRARAHWILIGQGTGITPLYALIKHVLLIAADNKQRERGADEEWREAARRMQMMLIDCNRQESDILLNEELQQMEKESEGQLTVHHVLSRASSEATSSRLNAEKLHQLLSSMPILPRQNSQPSSSSSPSPYLFLVCGSDDFHSDVLRMLQDTQHIREEDIFFF